MCNIHSNFIIVHRQLPICKQVYLLIFSLCLISILSVKSFHCPALKTDVILYQKKLPLSFLLYRLQIAPAFRALRDCSVDCSKFYFYKCSTSFYDTILVTLELRLIEGITLTSRPPFPRPFQCWPRTWTIPPKTHYKTTLEERKTELCYPSWVSLIVGPQVLSFYPGFRNCLAFDWLRDCCDCEKAR